MKFQKYKSPFSVNYHNLSSCFTDFFQNFFSDNTVYIYIPTSLAVTVENICFHIHN